MIEFLDITAALYVQLWVCYTINKYINQFLASDNELDRSCSPDSRLQWPNK